MSKKITIDEVGRRLKKIRGDVKQDQCAQKIGISRSALSHYEQGRARMTIDILSKFCKSFDVSADYILGLKDEP